MIVEQHEARPTMLRISVDFPAPLGPSSPRQARSRTSNEMPATAVNSP